MFKVGQKVVCKTTLSHSGGYPFGIKEGEIYTISHILNCNHCGVLELRFIGIDSGWPKKCKCGASVGSDEYLASRFEPLKYDLISNKDIIKEIVTERLDVPVKELEQTN